MALKFLNDGYFAGKVGIGTESPQTGVKLDVRGNVRIGDGSSAEQDIHFNNSTTEWQVGTNNAGNGTDNNQFYFYEGGNYRLTVQKGGNVGIGTTSPQAALHVAGAFNTTAPTGNGVLMGFFNSSHGYIQLNGPSGGYIDFSTSGTDHKGRLLYDNTGNYMRFDTNGSEKMRIAANGSVGIGNTAPIFYSGYSSLTLGGSASSATLGLIKFGTATSNDGPEIFTNANKDLNFNQTGAVTNMVLYGGGAVRFNNYDSTNQTGTPTYLLGTDASGNIVKTNTVPGSAAGPYLPLAGGTMTAGAVVTFLASSGSTDDRLKFGSSGQMQLFHDGSNGYIVNSLGDVRMDVNTFRVRSSSGTETMIKATQNDNVELYFNNVRKIRTTSGGVFVEGEIKIDSALLSNQDNTDVDTGTETVANVAIATYTAAFFDFVIKKTTNVRSGTVYACHDGTNVEFTETSTQDLGDTSDVTLSVDISGGSMRLRATTTSDDWSVKSLIRAI